MTIVVGLGTPDGLVVAADSRSTAFPDGTNRSRIASDSAEKVFLLCDKFAVATYGDAFIGDSTIAGLMNEFIAQLGVAPPWRLSRRARWNRRRLGVLELTCSVPVGPGGNREQNEREAARFQPGGL